MCQAADVLGLAIASVVSAAAWVYLVAAHGGFWRTGERLPPRRTAGTGPAAWPAVVAVVPARNEADSLPATLPGLLAQDYPGEFRVFLVDDGSDDGTGAIAAELGEKAARDGGAPLTVVVGQPRPDGWAGKVWAMSQGLAAARAAIPTSGASRTSGVASAGPAVAASAKYVLFTDADIAWAPTALRDLVRAAEDDDRVLVSQMALLRAETAWERVIVPAFVYFFAQLYPFRKVNNPKSRTSAAAGGCMLIRAEALERAGGLEPMQGCADRRRGPRHAAQEARQPHLARPDHRHQVGAAVPEPGQPVAHDREVRVRPAQVQPGAAGGHAHRPAAALRGAARRGDRRADRGRRRRDRQRGRVTGIAGLLGWALMTASYLPMLRFYRLSPLRAPALPLIALLYAAMTADSARRHYSGRAVSWRGRAADRV